MKTKIFTIAIIALALSACGTVEEKCTVPAVDSAFVDSVRSAEINKIDSVVKVDTAKAAAEANVINIKK